VLSLPGDGNQTVYFGSRDARVYALDAGSGELRWSYETGGAVLSSPAAVVAPLPTVYIGSNDHNVYALDAATGEPRWQFETGDDVVSSPAVGASGLVHVGSNDNSVYALQADGSVAWSCTRAHTTAAPHRPLPRMRASSAVASRPSLAPPVGRR
jgi:outer membrane protein assembly factor BamB